MEDKIIGMIVASTNLDPEDIRYEIDMINFSSRLSKALNEKSIKVYLFGGTALNKGFFMDKQRLSRDLDFEVCKSQSFKSTALKFEAGIKRAGYKNIRISENKNSYTIYVSMEETANELKIDLVPQQNAIRPTQLTLHSILEYAGIPIKTADMMSYPFEYLLAYKLNALHRRMLYKDVYDSYTALQMPLDTGKLVRYMAMFGNPKLMARDIIYNIENGEYDSRGELNYEKLVQEKYKTPLRNMLYEIRSRLSMCYKLA
jgi:predicted nucleotidyltransferase component of viral defense system